MKLLLFFMQGHDVIVAWRRLVSLTHSLARKPASWTGMSVSIGRLATSERPRRAEIHQRLLAYVDVYCFPKL